MTLTKGYKKILAGCTLADYGGRVLGKRASRPNNQRMGVSLSGDVEADHIRRNDYVG